MSKENFFETVKTNVFIEEVGECIFLKTIEEKPLRDALISLMEEGGHLGAIEEIVKKPKRVIISSPRGGIDKKIVDVFVLSSTFEYRSDESISFENGIIEDLSHGRTEFFDFRVKFVHILFQDITKIFKKKKGDKIVVLFLSDIDEEKMVNYLELIKNHGEFKKEIFYYYQNDQSLEFFENRLDFFFHFIKHDLISGK